MPLRNPFKAIFKRGVSDPWHWITKIISSGSAAGVSVSYDNAMKVSAVFACIKVISETIASLPLMIYERVGENGKKPAFNHPLFSLLHDAPNDFQTSFEFREGLVTHLNLRGNAYCRKVQNGRSISELIPLNPSQMEVVRDNGRIIYNYTHEDGKQEALPSDRVWHIKNMAIASIHNGNPPEGIMGVSPITVAREAIGLALAADEYGGRYFSNNAQVGLAASHPGKLGKEAKDYLKESLSQYGKLENKFKSIILEEGMKIERMSISNEDSQFLQSRQFQIEEIARIFRVPPVLIGHPTNTMTYASAEQLFLSFATYTIRPWLVRLEQSINRYLISEKDRGKYFAEFVMAGLLRGDTTSRFQAYATARQWGWMNVDEIRGLENMNPLPEKKGEIYLQPMNMVEAGKEEEEEKPDDNVIPFKSPKIEDGEEENAIAKTE